MKKTLLTLALVVACAAGAYAQGKVTFVNDSLHRYYMGTTLPADSALAGLRTPANGLLPSGITLRADLYAGTSSSSLSFISSTTMSALSPGSQNTLNVVLPNGFAGGVPAFFQVQIRDQAFATAALSLTYAGFSEIFQVTPSASASSSIVNHLTPAFSTWADGTVVIPGVTGFGAIAVNAVPEPSTIALAGLGAASLLLFRRRK